VIGTLVGAAAGGAGFWGGAWGVLILISFVPLYHAAATRTPRAAFLLGWTFGAVYWGVGAYWTYAPAALLMKISTPAAVLASAPLVLFWGLPWGLAAGTAAWTGLPWLIVPAGVAAEAFWPQIYPSYLAVALSDHLPAIQSLSLLGMGGVSWLVHGLNAGIFYAVSYRRFRPLLIALVFLGANEVFGIWSVRRIAVEDAQSRMRLRVAVLQGSVPDAERWIPERYGQNLAVYRQLADSVLAEFPELILFPQNTYERVWTYGKERSPWETDFPAAMRVEFPFRVPIILGTRTKEIVGYRGTTAIVRRHHAAVLVRVDGGYGGHSEKLNPTPFSEWMPGANWFPVLKDIVPAMDPIHRGHGRLLTLPNGTRLGALICYDAVKPWLTRRLAASEPAPDAFVLQTSDSWADNNQMPEQNLRIAVLRAVETRTPVFRAATSGISVGIDRSGKIRKRLSFGERGAFVVELAPASGRSLYAKTGNAAYFLAAALFLLCLAGTAVARTQETA